MSSLFIIQPPYSTMRQAVQFWVLANRPSLEQKLRQPYPMRESYIFDLRPPCELTTSYRNPARCKTMHYGLQVLPVVQIVI
jgi:hypothetical protein